MSQLSVQLLSDNATVPRRGTDAAAGYDLYAAETKRIDARTRALVKTDIALLLPPGVYGRIAGRSGLALKNSLDVAAGVVDPDYRGNVGIILVNHGDLPFQVNKGDRIAQLILEKYEAADVVQVQHIDNTARGAGGFGSTGQ